MAITVPKNPLKCCSINCYFIANIRQLLAHAVSKVQIVYLLNISIIHISIQYRALNFCCCQTPIFSAKIHQIPGSSILSTRTQYGAGVQLYQKTLNVSKIPILDQWNDAEPCCKPGQTESRIYTADQHRRLTDKLITLQDTGIRRYNR